MISAACTSNRSVSHGVVEHGTSCNLINAMLQLDFSGVEKLLTAW